MDVLSPDERSEIFQHLTWEELSHLALVNTTYRNYVKHYKIHTLSSFCGITRQTKSICQRLAGLKERRAELTRYIEQVNREMEQLHAQDEYLDKEQQYLKREIHKYCWLLVKTEADGYMRIYAKKRRHMSLYDCFGYHPFVPVIPYYDSEFYNNGNSFGWYLTSVQYIVTGIDKLYPIDEDMLSKFFVEIKKQSKEVEERIEKKFTEAGWIRCFLDTNAIETRQVSMIFCQKDPSQFDLHQYRVGIHYCIKCDAPGHFYRKCPYIRCEIYKKLGHIHRDCPLFRYTSTYEIQRWFLRRRPRSFSSRSS